MDYKAVCFDIDGTLYPAKVMNRRLLALGLRHPVFAMKYNRMRRSYRELQGGFEDDPSLKDASLRVREATILQKNYGICEKKDIGVVEDRLEKLGSMGLSKYVDFAASSENVGFLKPSVHCFEHLLYNMDLKPCEVLYVGDSYSKDVAGAYNAGIDAVLVNAKGGADRYPLACGVFSTWADFDGWLSGRMEDV